MAGKKREEKTPCSLSPYDLFGSVLRASQGMVPKSSRRGGHCCVEALGDGYLHRCGTGVKAYSYFFSFPFLLLLYFPFLPSERRRRGGKEYSPHHHHQQHATTQKVQGGRDFWIIIREMRNTYFKPFSFSVSKRKKKKISRISRQLLSEDSVLFDSKKKKRRRRRKNE